jgi:hypothetical protein
MRIRLRKGWRDYPIGQVVEVFDTKAKELIAMGSAEKYDGEYPPKGKMKTEFFKPKNIERHGKNKRK